MPKKIKQKKCNDVCQDIDGKNQRCALPPDPHDQHMSADGKYCWISLEILPERSL